MKLISTIIFLVLGFVCGAIFLYFNDWSLIEFITDPTTLLVALILISGAVLWWMKL